MAYKILTEIADDYRSDREDLPNDPGLRGLAAELKTYVNLAREYSIPLAPPMEPEPMAPPKAGTVNAIAAAHDLRARNDKAAIDRDQRIRQANMYREQVRLTQNKLRLKGATWDTEGNVTWNAGTAVVRYDYDLEAQGLTRAYFRSDGIMRDANGAEVDTTRPVQVNGVTSWYETNSRGRGYGIYVMSAQGNFHYDKMEVHRRHHSSLLAGMRVAGAGEFRAEHGVITFLSNDSGHYAPGMNHFLQVLHQLGKHNVCPDFAITYVYLDENGHIREDRNNSSLAAFMRKYHLDDDSYDDNNQRLAYSQVLTGPGAAARLDAKGWEYRDAPRPGVYPKGSPPGAPMVPYLDVRRYFKGEGTPVVQDGLHATDIRGREVARPL